MSLLGPESSFPFTKVQNLNQHLRVQVDIKILDINDILISLSKSPCKTLLQNA